MQDALKVRGPDEQLLLLCYKMCIALVSGEITTIVDTYAIGGGSVAQLSRLFATAGVVVNHPSYQSLANDSQLYPQGVPRRKSREGRIRECIFEQRHK